MHLFLVANIVTTHVRSLVLPCILPFFGRSAPKETRGLVTAVIGDVAAIFGCLIGVKAVSVVCLLDA